MQKRIVGAGGSLGCGAEKSLKIVSLNYYSANIKISD